MIAQKTIIDRRFSMLYITVYYGQQEPLLLGLALKLGFHPVATAHLSPGTSSLVVS
jgi:hypothetical protein